MLNIYFCNGYYIMKHICYRSKGSTPNRVFQGVQQSLLWKRATLAWTIHKHKMLNNTMKERQKPKKPNMTSFKK